MFKNTTLHPELPPIESGYELDPFKPFFSFVLPTGVDKTNLLTNPSIELATTGYSVVTAGTITRDSAQQEYGLYSLRCNPSSNVFDGCWTSTGATLNSGSLYFGSVFFLGSAGIKYQFSFLNAAFTVVAVTFFTAIGQWQRVSVAYTAVATQTHYLYVQKNNTASIAPFWTDGWQIEQDSLTTYIDGDQVGFVRNRADYYWNGSPHVSTSVRIGQSRHGGKIVPFADFGFHTSGILGLGMAGRINQLLPIARGGAFYQGSAVADRQFALTGMLYGQSLQDLQRKRKQIIDIIKDDVVAPDQPLKILYQQTDEDGNVMTPTEEIVCIVDGDPLVGATNNLFGEAMALTFRLLSVYAAQELGENGASLSLTSSVANANAIIQRSSAGVWSALGTGLAAGFPRSLLYGSDGKLYVGGNFGSAGGVANTLGIASWDGTIWASLGTGGTTVYALAQDAAGIIYAGGDFALMSGVANTVRIAKYNGSTWSAMGTGIPNGRVASIIVGNEGRVYVFGTFTSVGGVANTKYAAYWDGSVWNSMGGATFAGGTGIYAAAKDARGGIYVGGDFTSWPGSLFGGNFAYWLFPAGWVNTGPSTTGPGNLIEAIAIGPDGKVYVGGGFTAVDGLPAPDLFYTSYFFSTTVPVGTIGPSSNIVDMAFDATGLLYIGGGFLTVEGLSSPGIVTWGGSNYAQADVAFPGGSSVLSLTLSPRGQLAVGFAGTGTATATVANTINNMGSASIGPKLIITGPGILWRIVNINTGAALYFNLTLVAGETATLNLSDPTAITFISSFRGNILNSILAGSNLANFVIAPGANSILIFMTGTTGASAAGILWRTTHHALDTAIPVGLGL